MSRTSSALKANRGAIRKAAYNRRRLVAIDKLVRQTKHGAILTDESTRNLQKAIDKAAARGVIHSNRASRMKSRLLKSGQKVRTATPTRSKKKTTSQAKKTRK